MKDIRLREYRWNKIISKNIKTKQNILIVSHKWEGRGSMTSVEYFCQLIDPAFLNYNGQRINIHHWIRKAVKLFSNSKSFESHNAPYNSFSAEEELWGMKKVLKLRPKIIFFPYADYNYNYAWILKYLFNYKIVLYTYFSEFELANRYKSLSHFAKADLILAAGNAQINFLRKKLPNTKVEYFPLGVNTNYFFPKNDYIKFRIVHSGINRRDFKTLYDALVKLKLLYPVLTVDLVGCSSIKDQLPDLEFVNCLPYLSDDELRTVYQKAHLQLLILEDGGSSNSLNEGMACGLPVVLTNLSNISDYVTGLSSIKVPKYDVNAIVTACRLIFEDDNLRNDISKAARKEIEKYSWDNLKIDFDTLVEGISR